MTEWLINYAGGFVRRGLPGTLIGMVSDLTGIQANHLAVITGLVCFVLLTTWLLLYATSVFPAALVLSCIVMGIPAYQDSIVRKDCMGLLLLLGCLLLERSRMPRPLAILALNLLAGTAILSHEAFAFHALAGMVLFRCKDQKSLTVNKFLGRCLSLVPAGICFLLSVLHHGTPEQAVAVNNSWIPLWRIIDPGNPAVESPGAAIEALGWPTSQGLSLSFHMLGSGFYQPLAWAMVFAVSFVLMLLFTGRDADREGQPAMDLRIQVTALLLALLAFISPLFLLGVDYGRWLFLWVAGAMIFHSCGRRAPVWLEAMVGRVFEGANIAALIGKVPTREWYLLVFGVPVCWTLHNFLVAGPVPRHIDLIRSWF